MSRDATSPEPEPDLLVSFRRAVRAKIERDLAREADDSARRRERVLPLVTEAIVRARQAGRCGRAWLIGSYAWGEPGERSDVDLIVEDCDDTMWLAGEVGAACGIDVHVLAIDRAPKELLRRAVDDGVEL